jgi:hypothetical protein
MDALWKLGDPEPVSELLRSDEVLVVANAVGVLGAMGRPEAVRGLVSDPRPRVAAAARHVLEASYGAEED